MMEIYEVDECLDDFISIKIIGIGESGERALDYFAEVGHDIFPKQFIVSDENDVADLQDFVDHCDWLLVIMDVEDLELAEKVAKIIEKTKPPMDPLGYQFPITTFLILCPTADDVRLSDIPDNFCTWIILPKDKIDAIGLTSNELIYRIISVNVSLVLTVNMSEIHSPADVKISSLSRRERNYIIGMDFDDVVRTIGSGGCACIGFGESLDAENLALATVKNALQSPLFIEDIRYAKKVLLVFVVAVRREFVDISDKDADLQAKISDFIIDETCWLFVIADIEDLELAAQVTKIVEQSNLLITSLILCPSASDVRLADIPENFGTWIILPKDKIAASYLTEDVAIYRAVNMTTSIVQIMKKRGNFIGMDFADVVETIGNFGKACIGFGESLAAENPALDAVKKALQSPLFIEDIRHAKKVLLVFIGGIEFLNMLEMNEAATFLNELRQADWDDITLMPVDVYEPFDKDGVAAFILATNFEK